MKKIALLFTVLILTFSSVQAQDRITESNILGTWKMVIELDEVMAELEEEADESESFLAKTLLKSVSGIVEGVIDNIQIYMEFERGGDATVMVDAFDETSEDEDTEWYIKNNRLFIADTDNFNSDNDGYWVLKDDVLFFEDYDGDNDAVVYMVRVDD